MSGECHICGRDRDDLASFDLPSDEDTAPLPVDLCTACRTWLLRVVEERRGDIHGAWGR